MRGIFRGQGIGIAKAVLSLTMFHEARIFLMEQFKERNISQVTAAPSRCPLLPVSCPLPVHC